MFNAKVVQACVNLFNSGYSLEDEELSIHIPL
jgi:hypothetical protein